MASQTSGERNVSKQQSEFGSEEPPARDAGRGCHGAEWTNLRFPVGAVGFEGDPPGSCRIHERSLSPSIDRRRGAHPQRRCGRMNCELAVELRLLSCEVLRKANRRKTSSKPRRSSDLRTGAARLRRRGCVRYPPLLFWALANWAVHRLLVLICFAHKQPITT